MALTEADSDKAYAAAFDAIQARINVRMNRKCFVVFSAYKFDEDKVPIDNLDEVPIPGKVKIRRSRDQFLGRKPRNDYESEVLENPTWLDLCVIAHALISLTNDRTHCYLETISVVGDDGGVQIAKLGLGG
jgi:hypothetical protein